MIILGLFALGGAVAVVSYVQDNQPPTQDYPSLYLEAGLPHYPNATLTKKRQGDNMADGVQVTLETTDNIETIKSFFDQELGSSGFDLPIVPGESDVAYFGIYSQGDKKLNLQITKLEDSSNYKIHVLYSEQ